VDLQAPDVAGDVTITLPNATGPFALESYVDAAVAAIPAIAGIGLNVVQTVKTDAFTSTSATYTTVTGLSVTITPTTDTSKILVIAQITHGMNSNAGYGAFQVVRGATDIYRGGAAGTTVQGVFGGYTQANLTNVSTSGSIVFLDSPGTDSAVTYNVQARTVFSGNVRINTPTQTDDGTSSVRGASSITVIEVAA
jgi:hypothetical protein